MGAAIKMQHLSKIFHKSGSDTVHAVQNFSLNVYNDQILGLLGPNGAGKTTIVCCTDVRCLPKTVCFSY